MTFTIKSLDSNHYDKRTRTQRNHQNTTPLADLGHTEAMQMVINAQIKLDEIHNRKANNFFVLFAKPSKMFNLNTMTESERLENIRRIAENTNAQVSPALASFIEELKADKLAEELVVEHGLLQATKQEVEDQVQEFASTEDKADEDDDYDNDENLHDMTAISPSMRENFEEKA